eukprot:scaffold77121_cov27-Tisochrysis_lutea.AAC.2
MTQDKQKAAGATAKCALQIGRHEYVLRALIKEDGARRPICAPLPPQRLRGAVRAEWRDRCRLRQERFEREEFGVMYHVAVRKDRLNELALCAPRRDHLLEVGKLHPVA